MRIIIETCDRASIGSTPNKKRGIFFKLWTSSKFGHTKFKPFTMKWYLDDMINSSLIGVEDGISYNIENNEMLYEAIESGAEITNDWRNKMKDILSQKSIYNEIDGKFLEI